MARVTPNAAAFSACVVHTAELVHFPAHYIVKAALGCGYRCCCCTVSRSGTHASMAPKRDQEMYKVGDLVWIKVGGFPYWPGQVMDPETAPDSVKRTKVKGKVLVNFFGDNTHRFCIPAQLSRFEEKVNKYRHGVGTGFRVCCCYCSCPIGLLIIAAVGLTCWVWEV